MSDQQAEQLVDHLFRHEYGKMVAVLSRFLGLSHLDAVEDIVQETFAQAVLTWRKSTLPENPSAWLFKTAKRKAIDYVRKRKSDTDREINVALSGPGLAYIEELFLETEISDSQLRMIFACCHPSLKPVDQIALTLKIVSGFGLKEIANALKITVETIKKRIQRARNSLKNDNIQLHIPTDHELKKRLDIVELTIYLIFNEGYYATVGEAPIRRDLCYESMRLCKILVDHPQTKASTNQALLALMCFHTGRIDSREDEEGNPILLDAQDRTTWDKQLIDVGRYHLHLASVENGFTTSYHYEAAISAEHSTAPTFRDTNWNNILEFYERLYILKPTVQVLLNKIVVKIQLEHYQDALNELQEINPDNNRVLFHSIAAEIYSKQQKRDEAIEQYDLAMSASPTPSELKLLSKKRKELLN